MSSGALEGVKLPSPLIPLFSSSSTWASSLTVYFTHIKKKSQNTGPSSVLHWAAQRWCLPVTAQRITSVWPSTTQSEETCVCVGWCVCAGQRRAREWAWEKERKRERKESREKEKKTKEKKRFSSAGRGESECSRRGECAVSSCSQRGPSTHWDDMQPFKWIVPCAGGPGERGGCSWAELLSSNSLTTERVVYHTPYGVCNE